jgi:hypothetical protein
MTITKPGTRSRLAPGAEDSPREAAGLLADRIAATLVHHEPGWRLPQPSALARRYNVNVGEMHAAVDLLVSRQLVRRSADGRLYRSSPAEYLIHLEGATRLGTRVNPKGGRLTCLSYGMSWQPAPDDAAAALGITPGEPVCALRLTWALNDMPAAVLTTYLTGQLAHPAVPVDWLTAAGEGGVLPLSPPAAPYREITGSRGDCMPHAATLQMEPSPPSLARTLRLLPGQLTVLVTVVFGGGSGQYPAALTVAALRPDMFRIVLETAQPAAAEGRPQRGWPLAVAADRTLPEAAMHAVGGPCWGLVSTG